MDLRKIVKSAAMVLILAFSLVGATSEKARLFDKFGDINCEGEMARLDNLAIQLQNEPAAKAVLIFYGGKLVRGKLPRQGEAAARAARLKPYLVDRRGIPAERVVVIDGGYAEKWLVEVWVIPQETTNPSPSPTIPTEQIKFRKGKVNPRDYRCEI